MIVGKGEIALNEQFLLLPQCFLLNQITVSPFVDIFDTKFLFAAEVEDPKIGTSVKGLKYVFFTRCKVIDLSILKAVSIYSKSPLV